MKKRTSIYTDASIVWMDYYTFHYKAYNLAFNLPPYAKKLSFYRLKTTNSIFTNRKEKLCTKLWGTFTSKDNTEQTVIRIGTKR